MGHFQSKKKKKKFKYLHVEGSALKQCNSAHKPINYGYKECTRRQETKYILQIHLNVTFLHPCFLLAKSKMVQVWLSVANASGVLIHPVTKHRKESRYMMATGLRHQQ